MRTVAKKLQPLFTANRYHFGGFGTLTLIQLDHIILICTKTTLYQETTQPTNKFTTK